MYKTISIQAHYFSNTNKYAVELEKYKNTCEGKKNNIFFLLYFGSNTASLVE